MAYDPTLPANHAPISSAELRAQLAGLKDLIDQRPTMAQVMDAIANNAAANVDGFYQPGSNVSNPPTQAEVQNFAAVLNQLISSLGH